MVPRPPPLPEAPRVLVVRTGAIGDVVNALVFAAALRDARPRAHIGWVAHPLVAPLLSRNPAVDTVHIWPRGGGVAGVWRLVREVRASRYELAVDLQRLQKSALVARLSGAPRVLGYDRGRTKEASHVWTRERVAPGDPRAHMVDQYLEFARHLGVPAEAPRWPLPPLEGARERALALLAPLAGAPFVALNLGASKPPNRWPPAHFAGLADLLAQQDGAAGRAPAIVLTGGPGDRAAADEVLGATTAVTLDLVGRTGLLELAAVLEEAALVVSGDTGPMHVAAAVGATVVALFGPADAQRTGPYGPRHRVLREPAWDGVARPEARMAALTPRVVAEAVRALLGEPLFRELRNGRWRS